MRTGTSALAALALLTVTAVFVGCHGPHKRVPDNPALSGIPRELDMAMLPTYRVAPPDILNIEAVNNIRPPSTRLRAGDVLLVKLANPEPLAPVDPLLTVTEATLRSELDAEFKFLNGEFRVQPDGTLDFGPIYGAVQVSGMTLSEAQAAIKRRLETYVTAPNGESLGLIDPQVSVTWPDIGGKQPITGEHLVRPDGTIALGIYGSVPVAGLTLAEVKLAVEAALSDKVHEPEVHVDVISYNSKVFYVVLDGGGSGEQVQRFPITGNETVMDAIAAVQGLSEVSSKRIWVARPAPAGTGAAQMLAVNWHQIAAEGVTDTNYQLMPGDRIYVQADDLVAFDNYIAKLTAPFEKILGFTLLGTNTAKAINQYHQPLNAGGGNF